MESCGLVFNTESAAQTQALGVALAQRLRRGDVLALAGDLGAGKTVFVQGVAAGLGITAAVTSPTFVLINRYVTPDGRILQHADCYRLSNASAEMWDIGLTDLFAGDDIVVIEWADRIPELLPDEYLEVAFTYLDENRRRLCFRPRGARYAALLAELSCVTCFRHFN
jgi:tRNA threonylcarbamoyladenosine biosynthesis protein TsaE